MWGAAAPSAIANGRGRHFIIALALFTIALSPIGLWQKFTLRAHEPRSLIGDTTATGVPYVERVTAAPADSRLKKGDLLDFRQSAPEQRYRRRSTVWLAGQTVELRIVRKNRILSIADRAVLADRPRFTPIWVAFWSAALAFFFIPLFALVIVLKRPASSELRVLALALVSYALAVVTNSFNWESPWLALDVAMTCVSNAAYALSLICLAAYASTFGQPLSLLRRILYGAAIALALGAGVFGATETLAPLGIAIDVRLLPAAIRQVCYILPELAAIATIVAAVASVRGAERARAVWATTSLAIIVGATLLFDIVETFYRVPLSIVNPVVNSSYFVALLGLSYALFNRRLLDIGFTLNRATVFAALSLLVFGIFNLAEWALGGWLSTLNRTANEALSASLALGLGLSLKPLHDAVERIVDRVFFRKRHEAEHALRAFAREAGFYTEPATLLDATSSTLAAHAECAQVRLILERDGCFDELVPDDAVLVALRAWHQRLDLHTVQSSLKGEYAFPLVVRGKLTGVLAIGPKRSAEPYAPDELEAIDRIALAVGIALDGLDRAPVRASDDSLTLIRSIEASVAALTIEMQAVKSAVNALSGPPAQMEGVPGAHGE